MTPEELDEARATEVLLRLANSGPVWGAREIAAFGARLARENWTPPEPESEVDPDLLAFREWGARRFGVNTASVYRRGDCDDTAIAEAYLAGACMAREQERERAKVLVWELENIADADQDEISDIALAALAKYREAL